MGFSNFLHFIDNANLFGIPDLNKNLECHSPQTAYLIIDNSNIRTVTESGNVLLDALFTERYWKAILNSGYKIRIVKDGSHDANRALVKLKRMHMDMHDALHGGELKEDTFTAMKVEHTSAVVTSVSRRFLQAEARARGVDITSSRAITEADGDIRQMCRDLVLAGEEVVLLSNDASLMVGVPPTVKMFCPRRCHLTHRADGKNILRGPLISGAIALSALNRYICEHYPLLIDSELNSTSWVLLAALLSGEQPSGSFPPDSDPYHIISFVDQFLFNFRSQLDDDPLKKNKALRLFVSAAVLVSAWQMKCDISDFTSPLEITKTNLKGMVKEVERIISCIVENSNPLLFSVLPKQHNYGVWKTAKRISDLKLDIDGIVDQLFTRISDSMDSRLKRHVVLYKGYWGKWTHTFEPREINTELMLSPLGSLASQVNRLRKLIQAGVPFDSAADETDENVDSFNKWLLKTWENVEDRDDDYELDNFEVASTGDQDVIKLYWKSFKTTDLADRSPKYTLSELQRFVNTKSVIPLGGYFHGPETVNDEFAEDSTQMGWYTVANSKFFDLCRTSYGWRHGGGPLFNLPQRKIFLDNLISGREEAIGARILLTILPYRDSTNQYDRLVMLITNWWRRALEVSGSDDAIKVMRHLESFSCAVIAVLHILCACCHVNAEDVLKLGLVDACLLSPLFGLAALSELKYESESFTLLAQQSVHKWKSKIDDVLQKARGVLSSHPVGNLNIARWTEIVDIILKGCIEISGDSCAMGVGSWFDTMGFSAVLRSIADSIDVKHIVNSVCPDLPPDCLEQMSEIKEMMSASVSAFLLACDDEPPLSLDIANTPITTGVLVSMDELIAEMDRVLRLGHPTVEGAPAASDGASSTLAAQFVVPQGLPMDDDLDWEGNPL